MEESDSLGTLKCRVGIKTNMEHAVAMQITGAVLVLVAAMKNRDPIGFNKQIFGDAEGVEEVQRLR